MIKNFHEVISSGLLELESLEELRVERLKYKKEKSKKLLFVGLGVIGVSVIIALIMNLIAIPIIMLIVFFIVYLIWMHNITRTLVKEIKDELIKKLAQTVNDSFFYKANSCVDKKIFKASGFIKHYSSYSGEDYFQGVLENLNIEFSELTLKVKQDKNYRIVFKGPFFAVQLNQNFKGSSTVLPDTLEKSLGGLGRVFQKMNVSRLKDKLIKFENQEFEKHFAVYSRDEEEGRRILNENLCNLLLDIRSTIGNNRGVYFSYSDNNFYLGLNNNKDIFRINVKESINENSLLNHYNEFVDYLNKLLEINSIIETNLQRKSVSFFDLNADENKSKF
ncbi:MAG: DUF3137 domain-containing protein [bacterium]|nr:DUF3137 domain-containing protein [bacterium]